MSVADAVKHVDSFPQKERTQQVNAYIGSPSSDVAKLTWNALFVTELRVKGVWPQGCGA